MTVETETVSSVPALTVSAAGSSSNLRLKKSTDNITKPTHQKKKKKASRLSSQASKAEVFAARIASAVDEAQSSDSDETFVYESNPHDPLFAANSRPHLHSRASSSSLYSRPSPSLMKLSQQAVQSSSTPPSGAASPNIDSYQTLTLNKRHNVQKQHKQHYPIQQHVPMSPDPSASPQVPAQSYFNEGVRSQPTSPYIPQHGQFQINKPYHIQSSMSSDGIASNQELEEAVPARPHMRTASSSVLPRQLLKKSRAHVSTGGVPTRASVLQSKPSSQFRNLPKYMDNHRGMSHSRFLAMNGVDSGDEGGEYNSIDADFDFDDYDDDDFYEFNETTPLRINNSAGKASNNSGSGPRKVYKRVPGNMNDYSPHNYQRSRKRTRGEKIRLAFWLFMGLVLVLGTGFLMGFLLATNKPMHGLNVSRVFDVLVSDDELLFDVVIEAVNPGYLSIEVSDLDLDVFARSSYLLDEVASSSDAATVATADSNKPGFQITPSMMFLGNIKHFDAPLTFRGGMFSKKAQKAVGQLKLVHPGRNTTSSSNGESDGANGETRGLAGIELTQWLGSIVPILSKEHDETVTGNSINSKQHEKPGALNEYASVAKDEGVDRGQEKWTRINVHPFDMIIRGVLKYQLPLGSTVKTASISKVSHLLALLYKTQGNELTNIF